MAMVSHELPFVKTACRWRWPHCSTSRACSASARDRQLGQIVRPQASGAAPLSAIRPRTSARLRASSASRSDAACCWRIAAWQVEWPAPSARRAWLRGERPRWERRAV